MKADAHKGIFPKINFHLSYEEIAVQMRSTWPEQAGIIADRIVKFPKKSRATKRLEKTRRRNERQMRMLQEQANTATEEHLRALHEFWLDEESLILGGDYEF